MVSSVVFRIPGSDRAGRGRRKRAAVPRRNDPVDAGTGSQQPGQAGRTFAEHGADALFDERGEADELDGIAQALFGMQQNGAMWKAISPPERLREMPDAWFHLLGLPAPLVILPALGEIAHQQQSVCQIVVRLGMIGLLLDRLSIAAYRLREFPLVFQDIAEIAIGVGIIGLQTHGLLEAADRLVEAALIAQGNAEVVVRRGKIRPQLQGLVVMGNRLVELALIAQSHRQIAVRGGKRWIQAQSLLDVNDRQVVLANLLSDHTEEMQGIGVARIDLQNLAIEHLGLVQITSLVIVDSQIE